MRVFRRFTAVVLQGVLVGAPVLGASSLCGPGEEQASHMDMAGMAAMSMADVTTPLPADTGDDSRSPRQDCPLPWSPMGCQAMTSCTPSAVCAEATIGAPRATSRHEQPVWHNQRLRSVTRAPEPPPPRA